MRIPRRYRVQAGQKVGRRGGGIEVSQQAQVVSGIETRSRVGVECEKAIPCSIRL